MQLGDRFQLFEMIGHRMPCSEWDFLVLVTISCLPSYSLSLSSFINFIAAHVHVSCYYYCLRRTNSDYFSFAILCVYLSGILRATVAAMTFVVMCISFFLSFLFIIRNGLCWMFLFPVFSHNNYIESHLIFMFQRIFSSHKSYDCFIHTTPSQFVWFLFQFIYFVFVAFFLFLSLICFLFLRFFCKTVLVS